MLKGLRVSAHERGFTLLELIVSLSVLAIILTPLTMSFYSSVRTTSQAERDLAQSNDAQQLISFFNRDAQTVDRDGVNAFPGCGDATSGTHLVSFAWDLEAEVSRQATYVITGFGLDSKLVRRTCTDAQPDVVQEHVVMKAFGADGRDALELIHGPDPADPTNVCGPTSCTVVVDGDYQFSHTAARRVPAVDDSGTQFTPPAPPEPDAVGRHLYVAASWEAPLLASNQPAISGYNVYLYPEGSSTPVLSQTTTATDRFWRVEDRPIGSSWYFRVEAFNDIGTGPLSPPSKVVTSQLSVPDAPVGVQVQELDESLQVAWSAPGSDGGSPITGYKVIATDVETDAVTIVEVGLVGTAVVDGLVNGTEYRIEVQALNSQGQGDMAEAEATYRPYGAPTAPAEVKAAAGEGQITFSWAHDPEAGNGRPIIGYVVQVFRGIDPSTLESEPAFDLQQLGCDGSNSCSRTITGLENGQPYRAVVLPRVQVNPTVTDVGSASPLSVPAGQAKSSPYVRPSTAPDAPAKPTVSVSGTTLSVSYVLPPNGGEPIEQMRYQLQTRASAAGSSWSAWSSPQTAAVSGDAGQTKTFTVSGSPGTIYRIRVAVANLPDWSPTTLRWSGYSAQSSDHAVIGTPTAPVISTVTRSGNSYPFAVNLNWSAPSDDGGACINAYQVRYSPTGTGSWTDGPIVSGPCGLSTSSTWSNLTAGVATRYFSVRARNSASSSWSPWSANATITNSVLRQECRLKATEDTYTDENDKNRPHGVSTTMSIGQRGHGLFGGGGQRRFAYIKFDARAAGGADADCASLGTGYSASYTGKVPSSGVVTGAPKIQMYQTSNSGGSRQAFIFPVADQCWSEGSLTWNNQPGRRRNSPADSVTHSSGGGEYRYWWVELDDVEQQRSATRCGWRIEDNEGAAYLVDRYSTWHARNNTNPPFLQLWFY